MKGIIFTEFLDFVTDQLGVEACEAIVSAAGLDHGGAYSAVGTYDHQELVKMVVALHERTGTPIPELLKGYGRHLFGVLAGKYPMFIEGVDGAFSLLAQIDGVIHVNVRKLYPDAELPAFECERDGDRTMTLVYRSERGLADVAEGLMLGCFDYFGETVGIDREDLGDGSNRHVRFSLTRQ